MVTLWNPVQQGTWVGAWIGVVMAVMVAESTTELKQYCQGDNFQARCEADSVILISTAQYGRMRTGRCISGEGYIGCQNDITTYMDKLCSGKRMCDVSVASMTHFRPCKKDYTSYMEAAYTCVRVQVAPREACTLPGVPVRGLTGHIAGLVTRDLKLGGVKCPWIIKAGRGQQIQLDISIFGPLGLTDGNTKQGDTPLARGQTCPWNAIVEEQGTMTQESLCRQGRREKHLYTSETSQLELHFILQGNKDMAPAFIIKYQVVGCADLKPPPGAGVRRSGDDLQVHCNVTKETWYLTCRGNKWMGDLGNCTLRVIAAQSPLTTLFGTSVPFPQGLIIAVILGVVLGVVIGTTALAILLVVRKKRRRRQNNRPIIEEHSASLRDDDTVTSYKHAQIGARKPPDSVYSSQRSQSLQQQQQDPRHISKYITAPRGSTGALLEGQGQGHINTGTGYSTRRSHVYETPRFAEDGYDAKVYFELDPNEAKTHPTRPLT